jgi:hypothetical protein
MAQKNMDLADDRAQFFSKLSSKYTENKDGYDCNGELNRRKHLKRLRDALKENVLNKLRNCRDETLALELRWFRNCRFESRYEDDDVYLCPKYNPLCKFDGGRPNMHMLDPAAMTKHHGYMNEFADTTDSAGGVLVSGINAAKYLIAVLAGTEKFHKVADSAEKRMKNFFLHHTRVRDQIRNHSKIMRCDAAIGELRELDFSFLIPSCTLGSMPVAHGTIAKLLTDAEVDDAELTTGSDAEVLAAAQKLVDWIKKNSLAFYDANNPVGVGIAMATLVKAIVDAGTDAPTKAAGVALKAAIGTKIAEIKFGRPTCGTDAFIDRDQICYTGLMESEPFCASLVGSEKVAKAARYLLAGCHKDCPGEKGHLAEAYPLLTCAPGRKGSKTYWVNVVVQKPVYLDGAADGSAPQVVHKCEWVPAHDLMVAKLATVDDLHSKRATYVKQAYLCLKQKEGMASKPPCSDLETVNTGMQINRLRDITARLKAKGLSKEACMSLMVHNLDYDGYAGVGDGRKYRDRSRKSGKTRKTRKTRR